MVLERNETNMPLSKEARERQLKYIQAYDKKNYYRLLVKFRLDADKDLIEFLARTPRSRGTIIKKALKEYMKKAG